MAANYERSTVVHDRLEVRRIAICRQEVMVRQRDGGRYCGIETGGVAVIALTPCAVV